MTYLLEILESYQRVKIPGVPENMIHFENFITFDSTEINY